MDLLSDRLIDHLECLQRRNSESLLDRSDAFLFVEVKLAIVACDADGRECLVNAGRTGPHMGKMNAVYDRSVLHQLHQVPGIRLLYPFLVGLVEVLMNSG